MSNTPPVPQCRYDVVNVLACPRIKRVRPHEYECQRCGLAVSVKAEPAFEEEPPCPYDLNNAPGFRP